ncbi:MAG: hypothetical protein KA248_00600 [Kiritimatiellae bacterium]|nr:hypothetical protein [Kiritimatiellia bacterium]
MRGWIMLLWAGLFAAAAAAAELKPWTREWVDAVWQDHLLARGAQLAGAGAVEEALYRDALRVDPKSADAVEQLRTYYAGAGEPVLAAGAALYGQLLEPSWPAWKDTLDRELPAIARSRAAPSSEEDQAFYAEGLDAMLENVRSNNLLRAELDVRRLLVRFPCNAKLLENLCTFGRLGGEPAAQAMRWLVFAELHPTNFLVANNLAVTLEGLDLPGPAHDALAPFLDGHENDAYLMGNAIRLAEAAGRLDRAAQVAAQWRECQPGVPEAWLASTRVALRQGRLDEAHRFWVETVKRLDADQAEVLLREPPFAEHRARLEGGAP